MMWAAEAVAGFAFRAGFRGGDLVDLVAVSLQVAHGDDQWEWGDPLPGGRRFQGLFAVDRTALGADWRGNLLDAQACGRVAYLLRQADPSGWAWLPVAPGDVASWTVAAAAAACRTPDLTPPVPSWTPSRPSVGLSLATLRTLRGMAATVTAAAHSLRNRP